ncbi:MAG: inositol monophosphatase [Gammaproteobacteria bacterium]
MRDSANRCVEQLDAARRAAEQAAQIIRHYYDAPFDIETKSDRSPVTIADREAEESIRSILLGAFPSYGFYGEEFGEVEGDPDNVWLVDPLDGTKSFVRHYPFVSTQIALWREGRSEVGVSSAPLFNEVACAVRGGGAFLNDEAIRVSDVNAIEDATLSGGNLGTLAQSPAWAAYGELVSAVHRIRGYGDFYHYHLLAAGKIDVVVESDVNILDIAALQILVEEAGGVFTDLNGRPVTRETTSVLATNGHLHETVLEHLSAFSS